MLTWRALLFSLLIPLSLPAAASTNMHARGIGLLAWFSHILYEYRKTERKLKKQTKDQTQTKKKIVKHVNIYLNEYGHINFEPQNDQKKHTTRESDISIRDIFKNMNWKNITFSGCVIHLILNSQKQQKKISSDSVQKPNLNQHPASPPTYPQETYIPTPPAYVESYYKAEQLQSLQASNAQVHAPLFIALDPHDDERSSNALQFTVHDISLASWNPVIITNATILKRMLDQKNTSEKKRYLHHLAEKYTISYVSTGSLFILIPRWFSQSYTIDNCFNKEIFNQTCKTAAEIESILNTISFPSKHKTYAEQKGQEDVVLLGIEKILKPQHTQSPVWDISLHGHGNPNAHITGLCKESFDRLIHKFSKQYSVGSILLESCHVGGQNSFWINSLLKKHNASFNVFLSSIGEAYIFPSSMNSEPHYTADSWKNPFFNKNFTLLMQDYFNNVAQIDPIEKYNNSLKNQQSDEIISFEKLYKTLFERTTFGYGSITKGEYIPYFKLKKSKRFKTIKNMPGFYVIDQKNNTQHLDITLGTHTLLVESSQIKKLQLRSIQRELKNVNPEITKNLKSFFRQIIPKTFFPSWIFLTNNKERIRIDEIELQETTTGIHNFFGSFLTTNVSDYEIVIKKLTGLNDIPANTMNKSAQEHIPSSQQVTLTDITISRKQNSESINCSFMYNNKRFYLHLDESDYRYTTY